MSTATFVAETRSLSGDDARETLSHHGRWRLLRASMIRFVKADGFSHTRALAYTSVLAVFPGLIAIVGLSQVVHSPTMQGVLVGSLSGIAPGREGQILTESIRHAEAASSGWIAFVFGTMSAVYAGTTAMAQVERSANRMYGIERDRPLVRRYTRAFVLYLGAGIPLLAGLILLAGGGAMGDALTQATGWGRPGSLAWDIARWPVGILLIAVAMTLLFRFAPDRRQPRPSWLTAGSVLAVILWVVFTAGLGVYLALDGEANRLYGPLLGVIALMLWGFLSSLAIHLGLAFAAQLESVREASSHTPDQGQEPLSGMATERSVR
ncbi:MAG TPA: YihY/virulence factor BrkB family protein [Actinomycetota bacterium]